jgi:hypothetical protein
MSTKTTRIMNKKCFFLLLTGIFLITGFYPLMAQQKVSFSGDWNFEAPAAPEGYNRGVVTFEKDSSFIIFSDGYYVYPSNWLEVKGDSILYESDIDGMIVLFSLKIDEKTKISGNAVWYDGESSLNLTKKED